MKLHFPIKTAGALAVALAAAFLAPVPAHATITVVPHRAIYDMALVASRPGSDVTNVDGRMLFQWADACSGWAVDQVFQLHFTHADGGETQMDTAYTTWEAKNGSAYRFDVRKLVDGKLDQELQGSASMPAGAAHGRAHYAKPDAENLTLPAGTLFPTMHTLTLLREAQAGHKLLVRTVFDGSDTDGMTEVSAVIGKPYQAAAGKLGPLVAGRVWPIRLAFFPIKGNVTVPDYEMRIDLMDNGITRALSIDYGEFQVKAVLKAVEPLRKPRCSG